MAHRTTSPPPRPDHAAHPAPELRRHVGAIGLLFASVGSIIGSGWLFGAMNAAQEAGPAAILSWTVGMLMILVIALVYAELGTMFPVSGGVVRFPHITFGSFSSYVSGWILWIACATVAPIEVEGALQYATKYAPFTTEHLVQGKTVHTLTGLGYVSAVLLMALFVAINYYGVRWFERINNVLVWWKLAIILLVVLTFLAVQFDGANFTSKSFMPFGWQGVFTSIATSGIVFSFLGFRQGIELAGETDRPHRNVPLTVIGSVVLCGLLYIGLQVAFLGAVKPPDFAHGWQNLNFTDSFGPLAALSTALGLGWLAVLLYADAIISPGDTGLVYTTATSRVSYGMARNRNAPAILARTNRFGVPAVSLGLAFVVGLIIFLPFPSWQQLVGFITSATVLSFASGPVVMAALRRSNPAHGRPFRCPGGDLLPLLAFISSDLIVVWSTWTTNSKLFVTVLIGLVLLGVMTATGRARPPFDLRAGAWVIAFSVVMFYVALRSRLPGSQIDRNIEEIDAEAGLEKIA